MKYLSRKSFFAFLFFITFFSLFCQSNKPYAKNINLSLNDNQLVLTWENPKKDANTNFSIKNIYIYKDVEPILSTKQLSKENLVDILSNTEDSYIISDKNNFSPYFAVLYQLTDNSFFDILIIAENTTVYNERIAKQINKLVGITEPTTKEEITQEGLPEGKLRNTPLPAMDFIDLKENPKSSQKKSGQTIIDIEPYIFEEDKSKEAMGISYEFNQIISRYFDKKEFDKATIDFLTLLQNKHDEKSTARLYFYLGECYFFTEDYVDALNCFLQSEKIYPSVSKKWQQYVINNFSY